MKDHEIKAILSEKINAGGIIMPEYKVFYRTIVTHTECS
jgi:hypothetical protein